MAGASFSTLQRSAAALRRSFAAAQLRCCRSALAGCTQGCTGGVYRVGRRAAGRQRAEPDRRPEAFAPFYVLCKTVR